MKDYKYTYQNNCFNAKLSNLLDKKRTIIDIDCLLYKIGCKTKIIHLFIIERMLIVPHYTV